MEAKKEEGSQMSETWAEVGKAFSGASELYLKEFEAYLEWVQNVRKEVLEQTVAATQQFARFGEDQWAFMNRLQRNFAVFGGVPTWSGGPTTPGGATAKRPDRAH
jgi:hypothetical protein